MKNVLIFTSNIGSGHISIAHAIKEIIYINQPSTTVEIINIIPKGSSAIVRFISNNFIKEFAKNYHQTNSLKVIKFLQKLYKPYAMSKLATPITKLSPNLVICTTAPSTMSIASALKKNGSQTPHIVILADPFSIHHAWTIHKNANKYFAPTQETSKILINRHINSKKVVVTGFPLRQEFYQLSSARAATKATKSNSSRFTIFIGGSGEGVGKLYKLTSALINKNVIKNRCRLIVVCGKNKFLFYKLAKLQKKYSKILRVFGYINNIASLISKSNIVVGKAGPNILFESIVLKKPFIATGNPMGQEVGNYHFITSKNIGIATHKTLETVEAITDLIESQKKLKVFLSNIEKLHQTQIQTPKKIWQELRKFL